MGEEGVIYWQQVYFDPQKFSGIKYQEFWYTQNLYLKNWVTRILVIFLRRSGYKYENFGVRIWISVL